MKPEPVVILAAPHSDAARVAAMLGAHPRAFPLPHLHLFHCDTVAELLDLFAHTSERAGDGLLRAVAALFGDGQTDRGVATARDFLERRGDWSTVALFHALTDAIAPRVAVCHDTSAPLRITELDRWSEAAPNAAYVHLMRHPVAFDQHARADCRERLYLPPDYTDHADGQVQLDPQLLWYRVQQTLTTHIDADNGAFQLRLEDLHADARATLSSVCEWLGWSRREADLAAMLRPERTPFAMRGPDAAPFGLDQAFLSASDFAAPLGATPRTGVLARSGLAPDVVRVARSYGYD